jgi:hypothetical protein
MTNGGVANDGVREGDPAQQDRLDGGAAKNDDDKRKNLIDLAPSAGPAPPRAYNLHGRLVPAPALPSLDLTI